jgi:hypothetical protein
MKHFLGSRPFYRAAAMLRRTRSLGGASRAAFGKSMFGGMPNTARETPKAFGSPHLKGEMFAYVRILELQGASRISK